MKKFFDVAYVFALVFSCCFLKSCFQVSNGGCKSRVAPATHQPRDVDTQPLQPVDS